MDTTKKAWVNGSFLVATIGINALGALGYINGLTQEEISNRFVTLITPSPFTFGIWGVIYSLLVISVIMMIVKKNDAYYQRAVDRITVPFMVSCILNMAWIIAFSYVQIELSVLFIFALVITLALICRELLKGNDGKHWMLPLTFGTYTGWLLIATVVNTAAMLVKLNWSGFGIPADIWAIIVLVAAIILVTALLLRIRIAVFPLPVAWAYFGIYNYLRAPHGYKGEFVFLQNIALAGVVVLLALAAIQFYRNHVSLIPKS